uniref:TFIIS N-terminal domain-containing protein n=1 Tax=Pectinophora gossypiella TaxID=13191 RepID=A0A1E1WAA9_PECGO
MPRIDPIQLLNCLSVLLSPTGGIKSTDEVQRLASLMTKFSKKLVSKCIYIQILKCTETELLGLFMASGGWRLVHTWLTESIVAKNWPLVRELLELLLLCPVDIERLKTNNCPKLVKELSKDGNHIALRALASKLVEQWLKTVKGDNVPPIEIADIPQIIAEAQSATNCNVTVKSDITFDSESGDKNCDEENKSPNAAFINPEVTEDNEHEITIKEELEKDNDALPVLKISVKDGKQVISQVDDSQTSEESSEKEKSREKHKSKSKEKDKSHDKTSSKSSSSSKHSSKSHSSSSDKEKSHKSSRSSHHSSSKDKSKDKDRHSSSHSSKSKSDSSRRSSSSSSSKSSKDDKSRHGSDKDKSKDKSKEEPKTETPEDKQSKPEDKMSPSIHKLGKIPKLSDSKKEKPSISIEVRKPDEPKPKTVKTFHSKFRKHGLEEEVKPPPSRASLLNKKVPPVLPPTIPVPKRPSPVHNETPPEKKPKTVEPVEKPGAIKLIPPKPKPMLLLESDMFMDALNASATNKKEPKKRKRRTSGSKDGNTTGEGSPPHTPTSVTSPNSEKSVPPRFYQDTLDAEENKEASSKNTDNTGSATTNKETEKEETMDTSEPHTLTVNGLKGVLCYHKRKGPKKSIKWKPDTELEEIQYFELDETERVNVTRTFTDMKYLEKINERDAFQKARNLSTDDVMEEKNQLETFDPG